MFPSLAETEKVAQRTKRMTVISEIVHGHVVVDILADVGGVNGLVLGAGWRHTRVRIEADECSAKLVAERA
jgi:hypothetical protein